MNKNEKWLKDIVTNNETYGATQAPQSGVSATGNTEGRYTYNAPAGLKLNITPPPVVIALENSGTRIPDGEYAAKLIRLFDLGVVSGYQNKPTHKIGFTLAVATEEGTKYISDTVTATLYKSKLRELVKACWGKVPIGASQELQRLAGCCLKVTVRCKTCSRGGVISVIDSVGPINGENAPDVGSPVVWSRALGEAPPPEMPNWMRKKMPEWAEEPSIFEGGDRDYARESSAGVESGSSAEPAAEFSAKASSESNTLDDDEAEDSPSIEEYNEYIDNLNKEARAAGWGVK